MTPSRRFIPADEAQPPFFAGIDLGGTNIKIGLVDDQGRTLAYANVPTQTSEGPEEGVRRMGQGVLDVAREAGLQPLDVARVGLGTPGSMDIPAGMLLEPHNLPGWFHFPIRDRVSEHCGRPVSYTNDANAAAIGEYWCGTGSALRSMIFLTLGTGVGGGIIIDGETIEGEHSAGAECGHIIIDSSDTARICPCGRAGHLEAYASATGVIAQTNDAIAAGRKSSLADRQREGADITPLLVAQQAEAGDALANEIVMETARYLGIGIVTLAHTIDPNGVVLGGAMTFGGGHSPLGRKFLDRIRQEVQDRGLPAVTKELTIDFATLAGDAGYLGAAGLARRDYQKATGI